MLQKFVLPRMLLATRAHRPPQVSLRCSNYSQQHREENVSRPLSSPLLSRAAGAELLANFMPGISRTYKSILGIRFPSISTRRPPSCRRTS